jgi:hypothetical protein
VEPLVAKDSVNECLKTTFAKSRFRREVPCTVKKASDFPGLGQGEFVYSDIPADDGEIANHFLQCKLLLLPMEKQIFFTVIPEGDCPDDFKMFCLQRIQQ